MRVGAIALAVVLAACSGSSSVTTGPPAPATTDPPPAPPTTAATTTTTTTTTTVPTTTALPPECPPPVEGVTGDFDGDGAADAAYIRDLALVACFGDGPSSTLDVGGMGEVLIAVDLQGDGVDEILAGGTTAWGEGADVAVVREGGLAAVMLGGARLQLWRGLPPGGFLEFGCFDEDGDGRREVIVVEGQVTGDQATAVRVAVAIDGAAATELSREASTFTLTGAGDELNEPAVRELAGGRC